MTTYETIVLRSGWQRVLVYRGVDNKWWFWKKLWISWDPSLSLRM